MPGPLTPEPLMGLKVCQRQVCLMAARVHGLLCEPSGRPVHTSFCGELDGGSRDGEWWCRRLISRVGGREATMWWFDGRLRSEEAKGHEQGGGDGGNSDEGAGFA